MALDDNFLALSTYSSFSMPELDDDCCTLICPPGTVCIYDANGKGIGCLAASDAAQYATEILVPETDLIKYYDPTSGKFIGVFTPDGLLSYLAAIAP